jgi:nucleotide-binding universal stress UspA family protein
MIAPAKNRLLNILLADDGSLNARAAAHLLADLPHDPACLITALRVFTPLEGAEYASVEAEAEKEKNLLKSRHLHFRMEMILGYPSEKIIEYANEHNPDLIVMGAKGAGLLDGLLGSVAANVVHSGRWPVLIVRAPYRGLKRVLLVTDGSSSSQHTCDFLGSLQLPVNASVEVMHVLQPIRTTYIVEPYGVSAITLAPEDEVRVRQDEELSGKMLLDSVREDLAEHGVSASTVLLWGDPVTEIIQYAREQECDLIVCGSRGAGNFTGWLLGSVSRELVQRAPCSVLVVRSIHKP